MAYSGAPRRRSEMYLVYVKSLSYSSDYLVHRNYMFHQIFSKLYFTYQVLVHSPKDTNTMHYMSNPRYPEYYIIKISFEISGGLLEILMCFIISKKILLSFILIY